MTTIIKRKVHNFRRNVVMKLSAVLQRETKTLGALKLKKRVSVKTKRILFLVKIVRNKE